MKLETDPIVIGYATSRDLTQKEIRSRLRRQQLKLIMAQRGEWHRRGVTRSMCCLGPSTGIHDLDTLQAYQIGHHAGRVFMLREELTGKQG